MSVAPTHLVSVVYVNWPPAPKQGNIHCACFGVVTTTSPQFAFVPCTCTHARRSRSRHFRASDGGGADTTDMSVSALNMILASLTRLRTFDGSRRIGSLGGSFYSRASARARAEAFGGASPSGSASSGSASVNLETQRYLCHYCNCIFVRNPLSAAAQEQPHNIECPSCHTGFVELLRRGTEQTVILGNRMIRELQMLSARGALFAERRARQARGPVPTPAHVIASLEEFPVKRSHIRANPACVICMEDWVRAIATCMPHSLTTSAICHFLNDNQCFFMF